ncbi:MAG: PAS domain S-box protein [bacterium]|nr:PAS domain S-box protein [bacterium]
MAVRQATATQSALSPMVVREVAVGGFAWANQAFITRLGWTASALRGRALVDYLEGADREAFTDIAKVGQGVVRARHLASSGASVPIDWEIRLRDGVLVALGAIADQTSTGPLEGRCTQAPSGPPPRHKTLGTTLRVLAGIVEDHHAGLRCSILLLNGDGDHVSVGAGPSLPAAYNAAVEGLRIGPFVGSCGTAAYWNRSVVVGDIQNEALWKDLRVEAAAAGVAACWSSPIRSESGQVVGALALYSPVPSLPSVDQLNALGMAAKMVALAIDRGRAAESLRESEADYRRSEDRYRALYDDNPSMYFTVDPEGIVLSVNRYGAAYLGYSPEALVGQPVLGVFHPDDREQLLVQMQTTLDLDGGVARWQLRKIHRDGHVLWVEESARVIRTTDDERVVLVVCEDVTERWHANSLVALQSSVLASIASGDDLSRSLDLLCERIEAQVPDTRCLVLLFDPSGRTLRTAAGPSQPPELMAAHDGLSAERALGTCGAAAFLGRQVIIEDVEEAPAWFATLHMARKHGISASWSTPLRSRSGEVLGAISICHTTPQSPTTLDHRLMETAAHLAGIAAERQLKDEGLRRRQKLESLGLMAGGVAHDFNNLLVPMVGQCAVALAKLRAHDPARPHLEKALSASKKAADLTSQLLAYTGRGHFEVQPLDLNEAIREALHLLDVAIPKTVSLLQEVGTDHAVIHADPGQLQQILMNLVINAAESMGARPGSVVIRTTSVELDDDDPRFGQYAHEPLAGGSYVSLEVEDDGPGMAAATLTHVFDPFFTTKSSGRGLGLSAVAGIVRGHKGAIRVSSELERGTSFSLVFPSSVVPVPTPVPVEARPQEATTVARVLVIDDEEPVLDAAADFLECAGMGVLRALSGADGLELYRQHGHEIDLVLLDLSMPEMSGEETLEHLREIDPEARVLLTSGYNESEVASRFVGQRFAGFLKKPYLPETLTQTVRDLLAERAGGAAIEHVE